MTRRTQRTVSPPGEQKTALGFEPEKKEQDLAALLEILRPRQRKRPPIRERLRRWLRRSLRKSGKWIRKHPLVPVCVLAFGIPLLAMFAVSLRTSSGLGDLAEVPRSVGHATGPVDVVPVGTPLEAPLGEAVTAPISNSARPLSYWFDRLQASDWRVRNEAAFELVKRSRESAALVHSALDPIMSDAHVGVRFWAIDRLRTLGMKRDEIKAAMDQFAGNEQFPEFYDAIDGEMRKAFHTIVARWLRDTDTGVRWAGLNICELLESRATVFRIELERIATVDRSPYLQKHARALMAMLDTYESHRQRAKSIRQEMYEKLREEVKRRPKPSESEGD